MEALFVHLMLWGQERAIAFSLGMAPLSGFERSPVASLWNRPGAFLYKHGESLYGFQGLRAFKDKFSPAGNRTIWPTRRLRPAACPGRRLGAGGRRLPKDLQQ